MPDRYGTPELFGPPAEDVKRTKRPAKRYVKPVGYGKCPNCLAAKIAVMSAGGHSVWKLHRVKTWGGAYLDCRASATPICTNPEPSAGALNTEPMVCLCASRAHPFVNRTQS